MSFIPSSISSVEVLPAPLGPSNPYTSPALMWKLIPSTALKNTLGFSGSG